MAFIWECMVMALLVGIGGLAWSFLIWSAIVFIGVFSWAIAQIKWKNEKEEE